MQRPKQDVNKMSACIYFQCIINSYNS